MGALEDYAGGFTVSPPSLDPLAPGTAALLSLAQPSAIPEGAFTAITAEADLQFIAKRVGLRDVDPFPPDDFNSAVAGDFPLPLGVTVPDETAVEGLVGQLRGQIPISVTLPTVEARWQVFPNQEGGDAFNPRCRFPRAGRAIGNEPASLCTAWPYFDAH